MIENYRSDSFAAIHETMEALDDIKAIKTISLFATFINE
jgi:hypothetical protein